MVVDLNTASSGSLQEAGLTAAEVEEIEQFRKDNAVFHDKEELKELCGFSSARYEQIRDQFTTHRLQDSPYNRKVRTTEYRRKHGNMSDDWDVGHIVARKNAGADHSANYVPMSRAYNQKLKDLHDGVIFAHLSEARVREAVRASRVQKECPLTFNEALKRKHDALDDMKELKLFKEGQCQIAETYLVCGTEDCLCSAEYCERLIREWIDQYGS